MPGSLNIVCVCPQCHQSLRVTTRLIGREAPCPACGNVFVIERTGGTSSRLPPVTPAPSDTCQAWDTAGPKDSPASAVTGYLGRFELIRVLGQGAFGRVYQAHDPQLDREVALKIPMFASGEQSKVQRFLAEAKAAARLRHPNIVPVFECGRLDDNYYISSQYIRGTTLAERIKIQTPDFPQIARWVAAIAVALAYAHEQGIVHRDVKPQNIMLDDRGEPQIMDFGLAKRMDEDSTITKDGSLLGTPAYMAPEQARGESATIGPASDQYSVGVILYELLTGKRPFEGPSHVVVAQVALREPPGPRDLRHDIPRDLEAICLKAMQKEQAQRYASTAAMADDLKRWLNGVTTIARPMGLLERCWNWRRRNPTVANLVFAILLVTVTAFLVVSTALAKVARERRMAEDARQAAEASQVLAERSAEQTRRERDRAEANFQEAERLRREADQQRELAEQRLHQFEEEKRRGDTLQADANLKQQQITNEKQRRELAERQSQLGHYLNLIDQAYRALDVQPRTTEELLAECQPEFRSWEWSFLKSCSCRDFRAVPLPDSPIKGISTSPSGDRVAVSGAQGNVTVYGTFEPRFDQAFGNRPTMGTWARFGPLGAQILTGGKEAGMTLWDVASGTATPTSFPYRDVIQCAALSPDGKVAATSSGSRDPFARHDQSIRVWDIATGKVVNNLVGHSEPVCALAFSTDGETVASGTIAGEVRLWQSATGQQLTSGPFRSQVHRIVFAPDDSRFAVLTEDYEGVMIASVRTGRNSVSLSRKGTRILDATFSEDGQILAALDTQGQAFLWEVNTRKLRKVLSAEGHEFTEDQLATDGRIQATPTGWLLCLADNTNAYLERLPRGTRGLELRGHQGAIRSVCVSPRGNLLASSGDDATIWLWNPQTSERRRLLERLNAVVTSMAFLPGSPLLAIGKENGSLGLIDTSTGKMLREWTSHNGPVRALTCSDSGEWFVSAGDDGIIRVWRTSDEKVSREISLAGLQVLAVDIQPGNARIAVAMSDGSLRLWSLTDETIPPLVLNGHVGPACAVKFHPTENILASSGEDAMLRVWDLQSGQALATLRGHFGPVRAIIFSPSGDRLASVSDDHTLRVWEPSSGLEALRLVASENVLSTLAYLPDGQAMAVAGGDGIVHVFDTAVGLMPPTSVSPAPSAEADLGNKNSSTSEPTKL